MKQGRTLADLAAEVERQRLTKHDYVGPSDQFHMLAGSHLEIPSVNQAFPLTDLAHAQIAERLKIPQKYYDRMRTEAPDLLSQNVNLWLQQNPEVRMVRTLDGAARAYLSDRYHRIDHYDLLSAILPDLATDPDIVVQSCEVTATRLYIKFTVPKIQGEVKVGDIVEAGGVLTNSEVGVGAAAIHPFLNRLACLNGMKFNELGQRRFHVGKRIDNMEEVGLYSQETLQADDNAFLLKVRDMLRSVLNQEKFNLLLSTLREASARKISGNPEKVVELVADRYQLNAAERGGVLRHLIDDGVGYNLYGLAQAVTSVAGEEASYDRASELEAFGGSLVTLPARDWQVIAEAA